MHGVKFGNMWIDPSIELSQFTAAENLVHYTPEMRCSEKLTVEEQRRMFYE